MEYCDTFITYMPFFRFVKAQIEKIEGAIKSGPGTQPAPPAPVNLPTSYMSLGWSTNTKASWQSTISNAFFGRGPAVPDPSPKSVTEAADNDEKKQESSEDSHAEERKDDRVRRLGPRRASQPNIDPPPAHTLMKYTSRYLHTGPTVPRNVPLVYAQSVRNASHTADSQSNSSSTTHSPSTHNASSHRDSSNTSSAHDQTSQNDKHGQTPLMKRPSVRDSSPSKTKSSRGFFSMIPMVSERNLESINESSKDEEFEEESQSYKKVTKQSFPKSRLTVKRMSSSMIPRRASSRAIEEESVEV